MKESIILKIVLAIMFILAVLPWIFQGVPYSDDMRANVIHIWHMKQNIDNGHWPFTAPAFELYSGFPIFQFYSLTPYVITLPFALFLDTITALKASVIFSFFITIICMLIACNLLFKDKRVSVVAAVAYTFFTYHFIDAGSRFAFPELWAYSIFPLVIALFIKAINEPNKKNVIYSIIASAMMVVTHIPTAWMLGLFYLVYIIYHFVKNKVIKKSTLITIGLILLGTILLTAFSIFPLYTESSKVNFAELGGTSILGFSTPGLTFSSLFTRAFGNAPDGTRYFYLGYGLLALMLLAIAKIKESRFYAGVAIGSILLILAPFILRFVPLASTLQFVFRLLVVTGFCLAVCAGLAVRYLASEVAGSRGSGRGLWVTIGMIVIIIFDFYGASIIHMTGQPNEYFINPPAAVDALSQLRGDSEYFLVYSPFSQADYMYTGHFQMGYDWAGFRQGTSAPIHTQYTNIAFKFIDDLNTANLDDLRNQTAMLGYFGVKYITLPCGSIIEKFINVSYSNGAFCNYINPYFSNLIIAEFGEVYNVRFDGNKIMFNVDVTNTSRVLVKIFNFKEHWKITDNGNVIQAQTVYPEYILLTGIQKGQHNIELNYHSTVLQYITGLISILTLIGLIYYLRKK